MTPPTIKKIISVPGFKFSGISAGIKKGGTRDMPLFIPRKKHR